MRQVRLLPIVIAAGAGLLLLKGFGIMTGGGYVLTGPTMAVAAGGAAEPATGNATLALPVEPTMVDESPTIDDAAPTLPLSDTAAGHGETPAAAHGETAATEAGHADDAEEEAGTEGGAGAVPDIATDPIPPEETEDAAAEADCAVEKDEQSVLFYNPEGGCAPLLDEQGVAVPMVRDEAGNPMPLEAQDPAVGSENSVLERLAERRDELDTRERELDMRLALVEAAEKRITERTAALEMLEARIDAMVDEKRMLEEAHFTALVAMYETMKPKEAAAIFDELEAHVLLRVARAINPRKMGPIMAKMDPLRAKDLTAGLAVDQVEPTIDLSGEDLASLPQIVGQ